MDQPLALYVHWPFCISKCPYCDFNSHVRATIDQDAWRAALLTDLAHEASLTEGRILESIFFGGGTPSLMEPATIAAIIDEATRLWVPAHDIEISMEANPNSAEAACFADVADAGVNRISLGLQALDEEALKFLGRAHDVREGVNALEAAQQAVPRVSVDLIYARPGQSADQWEAELAQAIGFGTSHLSLYQLTIEPGTRFETDVRNGRFKPKEPDEAADFYEMTQAMTGDAGLPAYEVSNHAFRGAESRHNLTYWRYGDYVGIGPGAHGRRNAHATTRHRKPENWMAALARNGHGLEQERPLAPTERAAEALMMGLRLAEGADLQRLARKTGLPVSAMIDQQAVLRLTSYGLMEHAGSTLRVTPSGMLLLDGILADILPS